MICAFREHELKLYFQFKTDRTLCRQLWELSACVYEPYLNLFNCFLVNVVFVQLNKKAVN